MPGLLIQDFAEPLGRHLFRLIDEGMFGYFAGVPTASVAGYGKGAIAIDYTNGNWYRNTGSKTSTTWTLQTGTITTQTITNLTAGTITYTQLNDGTTALSATALEINRATKVSNRVVPITPTAAQTITLDAATYADKTVLITTTTVSFNIAIPAFDGTTGKRRIVFGGTLSSATVTITATGAHFFGAIQQNTDSANGSSGFTVGQINAGGSTIITANGVTQGGRKGDWIEVEDMATAHGQIKGCLNASGTEATPFS